MEISTNNFSTSQATISQQETTSLKSGTSSKRKWLWVAAVFVLATIISIIIILLVIPKDSVIVLDQPASKSISVKKLTLTKGGFLVFLATNRYGKPTSNFLAQTEYLLPDTYTDFSADFNTLPDGTIIQVKPGDVLFAALYEDTDGTKGFSGTISGDKQIKNWFGKPVIAKFRVK